MKAISLISWITALYLSTLGGVFGQAPITFQGHLGVEDGLKDRTIIKIDRDEDGYFWLLQPDAILRYDGSYFDKEMQHSAQNPKYFDCLPNGKLILISQELEISIIDPESLTLTLVSNELLECTDCKLIDINLILDTLYTFHQKGTNIVVKNIAAADLLKSPEISTETVLVNVSNLEIENIILASDDYILLDKSENAHLLHNGKLDSISLSPYYRDVKRTSKSSHISKHKVYFSLAQRMGTYLYDNGKISTLAISDKLHYAKPDLQGNEVIGLTRSHLHTQNIMLFQEGKYTSWPEVQSINQNTTDVYVENIADKFLFTSHSGLHYLETMSQGIKTGFATPTKRNGFGNIITSILEDEAGEIYFTKENGGFFRYLPDENIEVQVLPEGVRNNIWSSYNKLENNIWINGYTDRRTGKLFNYNIDDSDLIEYSFSQAILHQIQYAKNEFLISSGSQTESSLYKWSPLKPNQQELVFTLSNERLRKFRYITENLILINTSKRLFLYDLSKVKIEKTILSNTYVQSVSKGNGTWLIGTRGSGLIVLDSAFNEIKKIKTSDGLSNDIIYSSIQDRSGHYWLGTGFGLNILDSEFNVVKVLYQSDGLSDNEFNTDATYVDRDGTLYFGTINGITIIDPIAILHSLQSQKLTLEEFSYKNNGENFNQEIKSNTININSYIHEIQIPVKVNDFYNKNKKISSYFLNANLNNSSANVSVDGNNILLDNLKAGKHQLIINSAFDYDKKNKIAVTINSFRDYSNIIPAFLLFLLISLISFFIARNIIINNKIKAKERRENEVRMAELELQALRSQMNPHFIFNSLGAILMYVQTNEKKKAEKYLTKFAKLMRMFLESSKAKFISFDQEKKLLKLYLELEKLRFEEKFDYEFKIDERIDAHLLTLPSMLLQPYIENAINHGIYHKADGKGLVVVHAIPFGSKVKVVISDNGIGRKKATEIKNNSVKKHKSRATEIIEDRLKVLKKEKNIDISISYEDLTDSSGAATGTNVIIELPKILKEYD